MVGRRWQVWAGKRSLKWRLRRTLPTVAREVLQRLQGAGHEAWLVGGCVRDLLLGHPPKDWDMATSATPEQILMLYPHGRIMGAARGGNTVLVPLAGTPYEITPYRGPDLAADLARRDLTMNAMALTADGTLQDPLGGLQDLSEGRIRACGEARDRFTEDPLRMLRAIRLAAELDFVLDDGVTDATVTLAPTIATVAPERVGSELCRLLVTPRPAWAMEQVRELGLLPWIAPELQAMVGVAQNEYHAYPVWEHALLALQLVPSTLMLRLAALLHDVGKPTTLSVDEAGRRHFYGHELAGAQMAADLLERWRVDGNTRSQVVHLVRYHMDVHFSEDVSDAALRRMIRRIGLEAMDDLLQLRRADRLASGLRTGDLAPETVRIMNRVQQLLVSDAALKVTDLAVNGDDVLAAFGRPAGPYVGAVLNQLLEEVLVEPAHNQRAWLLTRLQAMAAQSGDQEDIWNNIW